MNALYLTLSVSLALVGGAATLFAYLDKSRSHEQSVRMALLPLLDDDMRPVEPTPTESR